MCRLDASNGWLSFPHEWLNHNYTHALQVNYVPG